MFSFLRRSITINPSGVLWLLALSAMVAVGCKGISPFTSALFAERLTGFAQGGGTTIVPTQDPDAIPGTTLVLSSACDLDAEDRTIQVTLINQSQDSVRFSMTFVASAGTGGFVCDEEVNNYLAAGYTDALATGGNTVEIGCDTLTLLSGTRLLTMEFGVNQGNSATLLGITDPDSTDFPTLALRGLNNGLLDLPVPELIVFGTDDPDFQCTGTDLCSQRGFVYVSATDLPVGKAVDASRIQGTICNKGFGTAPEWRLDKTTANNQVQPFQYAAGGAIVVNILDRSTDPLSTNRNQVTWLVTDADDSTIHFDEP